MKKIVITKDNYESIMFGLLENEYSREIMEDLYKQIEADTFLSFEWKQWSKTQYSEGLESYKRDEAEFIESLVKPEERKGGLLIRFVLPLSLAASLALFFVFRGGEEQTPIQGTQFTEVKPEIKEKPENSSESQGESNSEEVLRPQPLQIVPNELQQTDVLGSDSTEIRNLVLEIPKQEPDIPQVNVQVNPFRDSVNMMIQKALAANEKKTSRYKVSITEERMDGLAYENTVFNEKRYTMADVMNHKDGITLSKFLNNGKTKVIKDKGSNATYIEYIAEDNSVLVLTLSN